MDSKFTEAEIKAIDKKMQRPSEDVRCPRCGAALRFMEYGNSCEVKCETKNCIKASSRGI